MMKRFVCFITLFLAIGIVSADRGFILLPHIHVSEDSQIAIVAWNGEEEILMLLTNVKSSEPVEVWEVIPLPSEPLVEKGDEESFKKIEELYNKKLVKSLRERSWGFTTQKASVGVVVLLRKQIGVHNLTVVKAESAKELREWVKKNLNLSIPDRAFERYIRGRYNYFVFDKINISPEEKSVEPLVYTFKTDKAYYPLVITTETTEAPSSVSLFLITEGRPLDKTPLLKLSTVFFSGRELKEVHEKLYEMFPSGAYVTYYFMDYRMYHGDFVVKNVYVYTVLDLVSEWLNERFFVQVLEEYFSGSWTGLTDPLTSLLAISFILSSLTGLVALGYITYATVRKKFSRILGVFVVIAFYVIAVCVDLFGLLIFVASIPVGIGAYAIFAVKVYKKFK
ncbi:DUF2330 domain-containing protein [Archaeoglobus sp.]